MSELPDANAAAVEAAEVEPEPEIVTARPSLAFFGIGFAVGVLGIITQVVVATQFRGLRAAEIAPMVMFIASAVFFFWAGVRSFATLIASFTKNYSADSGVRLGLVLTMGVSFVAWVFSTSMFFMAMGGRGRQLRRRGKMVLAPVVASDAWAALEPSAANEDEMRQLAAEQWRQNGRNEHASVAAFAELTLDLMSVGAPPQLLADVQRDSLDEIRHAQLCFSRARSLDGQAQGPAAFPDARQKRGAPANRTAALAALAIESLREGALLEGYSARLLAKVATRCEDEAGVALLRELSADEGKHSRHGWDAVEWCVAEGGAAVKAALRIAAEALPRQLVVSPRPELPPGDAWERYGLAGAQLEQETYAEARAYVVARVAQM